jgi:EAL domain-containing protein (putative c-di-GMP-specific phosphodiesterase class I)
MSNLGQSLANLVRLRMRGFRLSIDDFGTGFATFEQLERIPFTELKIDRSIIQFLPDDPRQVVLVQGMLQMARGLDLATVAEGIETLETWNVLRGYGCDLAQGYLIARPMPGAQIRDWANLDRAHLRG